MIAFKCKYKVMFLLRDFKDWIITGNSIGQISAWK